MKVLKNTLTALAFLSLIIAMSCNGNKGKDDPEPDPVAKVKGEALAAGTWTPTTGGITNENTPRDEWDGFTVSFTVSESDEYRSGNYSTTNVPTDENADLVWKSSGTWEFGEKADGTPDLGIIYRDGDTTVPIAVTVATTGDPVSGGTLRLEFSIPDPNARVEGFYGTWVFNFSF